MFSGQNRTDGNVLVNPARGGQSSNRVRINRHKGEGVGEKKEIEYYTKGKVPEKFNSGNKKSRNNGHIGINREEVAHGFRGLTTLIDQ